jgi:hypothetical protein
MNDRFVIGAAERLAARFPGDEPSRIASMWRAALGRLPDGEERRESLEFVTQSRTREMELAARRSRIDGQIAGLEVAQEARLAPVRARLEAELKDRQSTAATPDLHPVAEWSFEGNLNDSIGNLHGTALGTARVEAGALVLDGESCVVTPPLGRSLAAKTLEVTIELDDRGQHAGGVMTVQDSAGARFDSLVYAERRPGEWMAGSNNFQRTDDFGGAPETGTGPIHLAIVYSPDGTIQGYRNGVPYGRSYRKAAVAEFAANGSQVVFGLRHGTKVTRGRMWKGKILEARLYDRALTSEEIASVATGQPRITPEQVLAALDPAVREACLAARTEMDRLREEGAGLGESLGEAQTWNDLAQSILNLKEFIHLR